MEEYKNFIEKLAKNKEESLYLNSGPEHAGIVLSTIFKNTKSELRIFAQGLKSGVATSDLYLDGLKSFLEKKNGTVKILIQEYYSNEEPKVFNILSYYKFFNKEQVTIKTTQSKVFTKPEKEKIEPKSIHFTTGDDSIFRLEEDIVTFKAFGSFNNKEYTIKLNQIFDEIFESEKSNEIDLLQSFN